VWDDNGHIHLLPKSNNPNWDEIGYEYNVSAGTLSNFYIGPSGGDWGFSDFLGADGIAQFKDKTVLCANDKNFQGGVGRTDQKYQIYNPNTKSMSNSALAYPNDQIASGNISNDCSTLVLVDVTETNSSNVFFLPGLGCFKGSYGTGSANTNTSVIFEANVTTGIVTEHEPANLTTAFNREGLGLQNETIFSTAVYGADLKIYAFPGSSDLLNGTDRAQGIMRMDPTDPANATLDTYSIWDTGTEGNAHLSLPAFLGADGYVHWVMGLTGTANVYLCSLDTNPTSNTYLTGYKQSMLYTQRYNVTSYTGSATSSSGFDEVVLDVSEAISKDAFPLTKFSTIPSNNSNLAFLTPGTPTLWRKSGTVNTYFLADSPGTSPDTRLQSGLGGEDPDGLAFDLNVVDPTFRADNRDRTRNVGYTANGKVIMAPTSTNEVNPLYNNEPIHVFNVNGTGYWKTQYATWNRNGFNPKSLDT